MTGVEALTGQQADMAMKFAVKQLGGQIAGRPIQIILGDSQSASPQAAVDIARKMVEQDHVVAIIGPTQIPHKAAVADYIKTVGIPLIFYSPTPLMMIQDNDWVFGVIGTNVGLPSIMGDYIYKDLGYRRVHTIARDDASGRSFIGPFADSFTALGGEIVSQQWAPQPTLDYSTYFTAMSDDVDAIVAWVSGADAIAMWTAWYEMGVSAKIPLIAAFHGSFTDYPIAEALRDTKPEVAQAMIGAIAPMPYVYSIDTPENNDFVAAWTAEYGSPPRHSVNGDATQALYLLAAAIKSLNGDTTPDKLAQAILNLDFTGPEGRQYFKDGMHVATKDYYIGKIVQLDNGDFAYDLVKTYQAVPPTGWVG